MKIIDQPAEPVPRKNIRKGQRATSPRTQCVAATQIRELEETIDQAPCDVVLIATPVDLGRIITIKHKICRATYRLEEQRTPGFRDILQGLILNAQRDESFSRRLPHR